MKTHLHHRRKSRRKSRTNFSHKKYKNGNHYYAKTYYCKRNNEAAVDAYVANEQNTKAINFED